MSKNSKRSDRFEYGYINSDGKCIVLGTVNRSQYATKAQAIQDANDISQAGFGFTSDDEAWFINSLLDNTDNQS